jgi:hypothetical protein
MLTALYILLMIASTPASARQLPPLDEGATVAAVAASAEPLEESTTNIPGPALVRRRKAPVTTLGTTCVELDMPPRFQWDENAGEARSAVIGAPCGRPLPCQ